MKIRSLRTHFVLAGCLLVATTVASGVWSAWTFARLSAVVSQVLRQNQQKIDLTAALAGILEREDDALLLAVNGEVDRARKDLRKQRHRFDGAYTRLRQLPGEPDEKEAVAALQTQRKSKMKIKIRKRIKSRSKSKIRTCRPRPGETTREGRSYSYSCS